MAIRIYDPEGLLPWRQIVDVAGERRTMLAVRHGLLERVHQPEEEAKPIGVLLRQVLAHLEAEKAAEEAAAGPLRGPQSGRPEPGEGPERERAQRATAEPERQGPEAGGSEPSGSLATGGRPAARPTSSVAHGSP